MKEKGGFFIARVLRPYFRGKKTTSLAVIQPVARNQISPSDVRSDFIGKEPEPSKSRSSSEQERDEAQSTPRGGSPTRRGILLAERQGEAHLRTIEPRALRTERRNIRSKALRLTGDQRDRLNIGEWGVGGKILPGRVQKSRGEAGKSNLYLRRAGWMPPLIKR